MTRQARGEHMRAPLDGDGLRGVVRDHLGDASNRRDEAECLVDGRANVRGQHGRDGFVVVPGGGVGVPAEEGVDVFLEAALGCRVVG